ncbi:MAG: hypothetical protein AAFO07_28320, partial [Bacteroidota bacterium]
IEKMEYKNMDFDSEEVHEYVYDENGNLENERILIDGEEDRNIYQTWNENGQVTEVDTVSANDDLLSKSTYEYNDQLLMSETVEDYENDNVMVLKYDYNPSGQLIQQTQELGDGQLIQEISYEYNDRQHIMMTEYIRTGIYQMLYGMPSSGYNQIVYNEIEYFEEAH